MTTNNTTPPHWHGLFEKIAHGGFVHREGLQKAIADYFEGRAVEPVRPTPAQQSEAAPIDMVLHCPISRKETPFRKCEFCGCNTNALARACCEKGRQADKADSADAHQSEHGGQVEGDNDNLRALGEHWHDEHTLGGSDCEHRYLEVTAYITNYRAAAAHRHKENRSPTPLTTMSR